MRFAIKLGDPRTTPPPQPQPELFDLDALAARLAEPAAEPVQEAVGPTDFLIPVLPAPTPDGAR